MELKFWAAIRAVTCISSNKTVWVERMLPIDMTVVIKIVTRIATDMTYKIIFCFKFRCFFMAVWDPFPYFLVIRTFYKYALILYHSKKNVKIQLLDHRKRMDIFVQFL